MIQPWTDEKGRRWYEKQDGHWYVGVTTAVGFYLHGDTDPWAGVNPVVLKYKQMEGIGCHRACLDWLGWQSALLPEDSGLPPCPPEYGDPGQWRAVIANALQSFQAWALENDVRAEAIEEPSHSVAYGLAGTPDFKGYVRKRKRVVDLKFTAGITLAHRVQTATYGKLDGYKDTTCGMVVRIDTRTGKVQQEHISYPEYAGDVLCVCQAAGVLRGRRNRNL